MGFNSTFKRLMRHLLAESRTTCHCLSQSRQRGFPNTLLYFALLTLTKLPHTQAHKSVRMRMTFFYVHGSVHRESNLLTVQQDATVFSLLYFCRQLYMFRVLTPIIRSSYKCNYSVWHWSNGSATVRSRCWVPTQQLERMVADPFDQCQKL